MNTKSILYFLILLLFVVFSFGVQAQQSIPLSLNDAINKSLATSEDIKQANNEISKAGHRYKEALGSALPHINTSINYNHYPNVMTFNFEMPGAAPMSVSLSQDNDFTANVTLNQTIYSFGRVGTAIKAAKSAKQLVKANKDSTLNKTIFDTTVLYYTVKLAEKSLFLAKKSKQHSQNTLNFLNESFHDGRIPREDNIKAQADISMRVPLVKKAQSDLTMAINQLKTTIGISINTPIKLTTSFIKNLPDKNIHKSLEKLTLVNPQLKSLKANAKFTHEVSLLYKAQMLPHIDGFASYSYFGQGDEFGLGDADFQNLSTIGISMTIPIWNGGQIYHKYRQSVLDKNNASLVLNKTKKQLKTELTNTITQYQSQKEQLKDYSNSVYLSRQSYLALQDKFKAGKISLTVLNNAELQWTQAEINRLMTWYQAQLSLAKIEFFIAEAGDNS